jgi:hypothetical protein
MLFAVQEKTSTNVWIPLHRDLRILLDQTHVTAISCSTAHGASRFPRRKACTKKSKQCCAVGEGSYVPHGLRATAAVRLIELGRFRGPGCGSYWHRDLNVLRGYVRGVDGPPSHAEAGGKLIGHSKANSAKVPNP